MKWPLLMFDLDGTLIDSAEDITSSLNRTLTHYGKPTLPHEVVVAHIGDGLLKLLGDFFPEYKNKPPEEYQHLVDHFLRNYEEEMFQTTRPYPGALDFLRTYEGPVGVITNKNQLPAKKILQYLGFGQVPWIGVFGADTFAHRKPHPLPLQEMMKRAGTTPQNSFMIGDGTPDMESAHAAGVPFIAIGFGYTKLEILQKYGPAGVLKDYAELHNMIHYSINR